MCSTATPRPASTRAIVNVHHKADLIEAHLKGRRRPAIEISDERGKLLDTGGGVKKALPRLGDGAVLDSQRRLGVDRRRGLQPRPADAGLGR